MNRRVSILKIVIIVMLVQGNLLALTPGGPNALKKQAGSRLFESGDVLVDSRFGTRIVRVTGEGECFEAEVAASDYSSFNVASRRFFINVDGVPTLYNFDPETLQVEKQGPLFDDGSLQLSEYFWSVNDPDTIFGMDNSEETVRLFAYNVETRSYALLKTFADELPKGNAQGLSKSWVSDDRFAFSWRESEFTPWQYVVVWDGSSDLTHLFDLTDQAAGVSGYRESHLSKRGRSLVVIGDVTREWSYQNQSQSYSLLLDSPSAGQFESSVRNEQVSYLADMLNGDENPALPTVALPHSNISRDGRFRLFSAHTDGEQTHVFVSTLLADTTTPDAVIWTNLVNTSSETNSIRKTGGQEDVDDASASSLQSVSSGDAYFEFTVTDENGVRIAGLNNSIEIHQQADDIDFAIRIIKKKKYEIRENGILKKKGRFVQGAKFRIAIEDDIVKYYISGSLVYTSDDQIQYPQIVSTSLLNNDSAVSDAMIAGATINPEISIPLTDASTNLTALPTVTSAVTGSESSVVTDYGVYEEPPAPALPSAGGKFTDPTFGTTIMRVTDNSDGSFNSTSYSYWPSFNLDNSRLFITAGGSPTLYNFDPVSFSISNKRPLFNAPLPTGGYPLSEDAIWSGTNPNIIYCHAGLRLWGYNVNTNSYTLIKDFSNELPAGHLWQMSRSIDDKAFAFTRKDTNYSVAGYLVWRQDNNSIYRTDTTDLDEVQVDKTGNYLIVLTQQAGSASAIEAKVVNLQTGGVENLTDGAPDYAPGHKDMGSGFVIGGENWNNRFLYRDMATPHQYHSVMEFGNDWSVGSHASMLADNEEWMLFSTFVANSLPSSHLFRNEIFQVTTDGSMSVRRLAHTHSVYREYWDSPRATISRDGQFVVFTSNWGSTSRRDVFIVKVPPAPSSSDTNPPAISNVSSSGISTSGATITWTTDESSDTQVEYGSTTGYGSSTQINTSMVTNHSVSLSGLKEGTLYHYRVKSRDAAGNLAVSSDKTFTTTSSGGSGGGGGSTQNVVWTNAVKCSVNGNSLLKTSGYGDTPDAGAMSQQMITSGSGYVEFTVAETNKTRYCGLANTVTGTNIADLVFGIKLGDSGVAEVRELNVYKAETNYRSGDVFRISIESGSVKYYKNGALFYTSSTAPSYPLRLSAVLIGMYGTINNAVIASVSGGGLAADFGPNRLSLPDSEIQNRFYALNIRRIIGGQPSYVSA